MTPQLRLEGIYDLRTLAFLKEQGVFIWGFDLRVQSLNFLQSYKLVELLKKEGAFAAQIFLRFENEKDFVIKKTLLDLKEECPDVFKKVILEFSDSQNVSFYESFGLPFIWYFQSLEDYKDILKSAFLKGICLSDSFFENNFSQTFFSLNPDLLKREIDFILKFDENFEVPKSFDFFDLSIISYELNSDLEVCYRNVDLKKLFCQIEKLKKVFVI